MFELAFRSTPDRLFKKKYGRFRKIQLKWDFLNRESSKLKCRMYYYRQLL